MDFLILFLLYMLLVLLSIPFVCFYSGRKQSFPSRLATSVTKVFSYVIPSRVQGAVQRVLRRLFHSRNCLFMVLHLVLEALVYGEFSWEVFGYCQELQFSTLFLLFPYFLLTVNVGFFILCSRTNPGTITKSNQALFLHVYAYDGVMFEKGVECSTCKVRKPARSKHCGVCNSCVHRFDHHCVWVNNCIGAFNIRHFLVYLLTLTSMAASIAVLTATFLIQVVILSNMMLGHYTDDQGQEHPVDAFFVIQHLFLTFPRVVFMLGFVTVLSIVLGSYLCFALYLILTNQTSNEWFKSTKYQCSCSEPYSRHGGYKNIYSRGVWGNITEIVTPLMSPEKKKR
ncbi:palmitoyltransferase ZDHHC4 [Rhineura floridana]|uniref:palmitoyltransferase ZDHHC4 n=1 Tax=Rhineura floridana TaxID=261503 RepID=UPI002AC7F69B|nr:palmitoyltransferase ZDHHC4 [Rhineura floridana]XP_061456124.1 palmitoyltransferase ZDHHC4 [Rhineura floridana]XP_061456125.1 palmitoyltransferase ZDHHC4 [Rhineura floridana]XP_061456126.1 palmitoyltransferase ZDHHC4 [Rhineura floridana]XP_061456127.1 palmitoyltransferase ZDHHC4 [Rhineura floridana]XP_061456128.1 palmitoyltransferase ZDHHC4 [Rhineura floridana]